MKILIRSVLAVLVTVLATMPWSTSPGSSEHFILTNGNDYVGNNFGSGLKLTGTPTNFSLVNKGVFATGGSDGAEDPNPDVQIIRHGPDTCVFLSSAVTMDIAAFQYPSLVKVGDYTDGAVANSRLGIVLAARGNYLFAGYNGQTSQDGQIGVWQIERGCALTLLNTYTPTFGIFSMAVSPDGKALVISYWSDYYVGSYGIGPKGTLTGPYDLSFSDANGYRALGVDITADSKYAIIDLQSDYTAVDVFPINSEGSLGDDYYTFGGNESLGNAVGGGWIWLSPNQKFLFETDNSDQVITLNFDEDALIHGVTYTGCTTSLRVPNGNPFVVPYGMATALPSGAGRELYVAEDGFDSSYVGLLSIDPSTGCTTEEAASPSALSDPYAGISTLAAWPPRPF